MNSLRRACCCCGLIGVEHESLNLDNERATSENERLIPLSYETSAMPGIIPGRDKIDTSLWDVKDWRFARLWNAGFLVYWTVFSISVIVEAFKYPESWFFSVPMVIFLVFGFIHQVVGLIRITLWLRRQKSTDQ